MGAGMGVVAGLRGVVLIPKGPEARALGPDMAQASFVVRVCTDPGASVCMLVGVSLSRRGTRSVALPCCTRW